jgi:hypothetical protein
MSVSVTVTSADGFFYEVDLDDSSIVDNPTEYRVSIIRILPEDPVSFGFTRLIKKDFIVNIVYEPDIEWDVYLDEVHDEMLAAIGQAYLTEIGY